MRLIRLITIETGARTTARSRVSAKTLRSAASESGFPTSAETGLVIRIETSPTTLACFIKLGNRLAWHYIIDDRRLRGARLSVETTLAKSWLAWPASIEPGPISSRLFKTWLAKRWLAKSRLIKSRLCIRRLGKTSPH